MPRSARYLLSLVQKKRLLYGLTILIFQFSAVFEIAGQYRFDSWTTDNGLPQSSVNSIWQTRDGFLWLTTFSGLVRYDGLRFQVFSASNTKGLTTSRFLNLYEARSGDLWITNEGRGITRYRDGFFTTYAAGDLPDGQIEKAGETEAGELLVECAGRTFVFRAEKFTEYEAAHAAPHASVRQRMTGGAAWYAVGTRLQKFENERLVADHEFASPVLRSFEDSRERVWIAQTGETHLAMLADNRLTTYTDKDGYAKFRFISAAEDRQGGIWFATDDGLVKFQDNTFKVYRVPDGLVSNRVNCIFQDREGAVWVGTQGGLNRLIPHTVTAYSTADGLAADNVYAIYQDSGKRVWIGSWLGLTVYENGRFENVSERFQVADENITALLEDRAGNFWVGAWSGKVKRIKNGEVISTLPADFGPGVRVIYEDAAGIIWIGTSRGLFKFQDGQIIQLNANDEFAGLQIQTIKEDRAGNLWIGTGSGLFRYENDRLNAFTENAGAPAGIVRAIYEDAENSLWIGTYDHGLYRFKDNRFTHFTTDQGLYDNGAFQILEDNAENFWISCNLGIYRVKKSELNSLADGRISKIASIPYNKSDGMLNAECNGGASPAGIRAADGRLWFPTQKGVAVVDPKAVPFNSLPPPVVIESIVIDTKAADLHSPVQIQPEQTNLEIHYSGLSFINPELVNFKYKLENLDKDWIDASTRRTAFYSHLPPGKYLFRVIAANRDGVWNEQGAAVEITVAAAFWQTNWFYAFAVLTGFIFVIVVFHLRELELRRRQRVQEEFSRKLLESQETERKRIASEMHDSLGQYLLAIKNWALFGLNSLPEKDAGREYLAEVSETSSLAIEEVREIAHNLRPYQLERLGLTNTLEYLLKNFKSASPLEISYEIENIDGFLSKPDEIVFYRVVQECLNNVIKHSEARSARISVKMENDFIRFVCFDDGHGFDVETAKNSAASGLGLSGIVERVKILKGELQIKSEKAMGTKIFVSIGKN